MTPGSDEAIAAGCLCPVMDNGYGRGYLGSSYFVMHEGCPIHGSVPPACTRKTASLGKLHENCCIDAFPDYVFSLIPNDL